MKTTKKNDQSKSRARPKLSTFARKLLSEWKRLELPTAEQPVVVAVSGGADSTALLLALDELSRGGRLSSKVLVAHLDHGLRGDASREDAHWVAELGRELGCKVVLEHVDVREDLNENVDNLEQAARRVRYRFLTRVAEDSGAKIVLTAHTMDDQAETVMLRLLRGSGMDGLGGMEPVRRLYEERSVLLARPLLRWARRADTEGYCGARQVNFRLDAMNQDERLTRVRVRKQLLPLMQTFNGRVVETLTRTAELFREDSSVLEAAAEVLLHAAADETSSSISSSLRVDVLASAHASLRRRALRQWIASLRGDLRRLERVHLLEVEKLVFGERGGRIAELPGGSYVERKRGVLLFHADKGK